MNSLAFTLAGQGPSATYSAMAQTRATEGSAAIKYGGKVDSSGPGIASGPDRLTISQEGRQRAASIDAGKLKEKFAQSPEEAEESKKSQIEKRIQQIKERIEDLRAEKDEIEQSTMDEKQKQIKKAQIEAQIAALNSQLQEAYKELNGGSGAVQPGGTPAQGMGNSLAEMNAG